MSQAIPPEFRAEIEQACATAGVTLIDLVVRGQHRQLKMDVIIDTVDGVTHDHCRSVSREIDERLSEDEFFDRLRSIDVSSPGADAPVTFLWQLKKNVGRTVRVEMVDGTVVEGPLRAVEDTHLEVQPSTKKSKSQPVSVITIPSSEVKLAHVVISFH